MLFAHDTEEALASTVALVNTAGPPDELRTTQELDAFVALWGWTGSRTHDGAELRQVLRLRERLRALWGLGEEDLVDDVNAMLRDCRALPQLVRHDEWDWHLHATRPEQPLAERMMVESAMALVDVLRAGESGRMSVCEATDCDDVLIDLSRNRSRRYCSQACTNRMAAAAYRARRSRAGATGRGSAG